MPYSSVTIRPEPSESNRSQPRKHQSGCNYSLRRPVRNKNSEAGQALLLVLLGMGIFLLGALGLALDGSNLYANRQMAQAAADAAAEAGIMSMFDGTNSVTGNTHKFTTTGRFTCATSDARTPCYYAQTMNGFNGASDTVTVDFPTAATLGIPTSKLSSTDPVNLLRVTVQRQVSTTLMALLGPASSTIGVSGTAGISSVISAVPLLITHPTLANALSGNGATSFTITGGPPRSVQVNSNDSSAFSVGSVDLSAGGPGGTGSDFGVFGGPTTKPTSIALGSTGHYLSPSSPIQDPLAGVAAPSVPAVSPPASGQSCTVLGHCASCPASGFSGAAPATCIEYLPGAYPAINLKNINSAIFDPGVYYIQGGGFTIKNSTAGMCTTCAADATTVNGLVIYDAGATSTSTATGGFTIDTQGDLAFVGAGVDTAHPTASPASPYYGIMFFEQRNADAQSHSLGQGNSCFSFTGIIYIANTLAIMQANANHYQSVSMNGGPCAGLSDVGGFILNELSIVGNSSITMQLFPTAFLPVRTVALVQ